MNAVFKSQRTREELKAEVLKHNNVPPKLAAEYIGVSEMAIYGGLRFGKWPFGVAFQQHAKKWTYHISPYKLIEYQEGIL